MNLTFGSLFAGIGGFDLGLERAGMQCRWQVEIDPFCRKVLAKHWPAVARYEDVKEVGAANLEPVDVICGGFPCQDISVAGKGAGLAGARSGLWSEFARIIGEMKPAYALIENVPRLRRLGLDKVLQDIAALGYDAEWHCIPASAIGAPHQRDRIWIVAYPNQPRLERRFRRVLQECPSEWTARSSSPLENTNSRRRNTQSLRCSSPQEGHCSANVNGTSTTFRESSWWSIEPNVGRVANGVPARVDRLKSLGNAVVPQLVEWLGLQIMEHAQQPYE